VRRGLQNIAGGVDNIGRATPDSRLGSVAQDVLDDFSDSLVEADVVSGDPAAVRATIRKFNELWRRVKKTDLLDDVIENQDNYLGGPVSAVRNKIGTILRNPKYRKNFNEAELRVLRQVVQGRGFDRLIRSFGNGLGRLASAVGGAEVGGALGLAAGAGAGELAAEVAERQTVRAAELARDLISSGRLQNIPEGSDTARKIVEALMRRGVASAQGY